jgi:DNA repair protein RadD
MLTLRPYQVQAVADMDAALAADRSKGRRHAGVCSAAVGAGKSILISEMARRETEEREGRVLVLANVRELVEQDAEKIELASGERPDVFSAGLGRKEGGGLIVVAGIQSLARNPLACGRFSLILADEAHGIPPEAEGQWRAVIDAQGADIIGFTGTPWRLNSGPIYGMGRLFDRITSTISIADLQEMGHLVQVRSKLRDLLQVKIGVKAGEYDIAQQEQALRHHDILDALNDHCTGRHSVLVFVPGVETGENLTQRLIDHGHRAGQVYGHTPSIERAETIRRFKAGEIRFLVNCGTLTTGFDCPRIDCVVLLRKTMSGALLVQMIGRGLRPSPDHKRDVLLLDYAANFAEHPPVQEIGPPEKGREQAKKTHRACPSCEELVRYGVVACPCCGYVFPVEKQERDLAFCGLPTEMAGAAGRPEVRDFQQWAKTAKDRAHKPISALIRYKEKYGRWPSSVLARTAGHPFEWAMVDGRRGVQWI